MSKSSPRAAIEPSAPPLEHKRAKHLPLRSHASSIGEPAIDTREPVPDSVNLQAARMLRLSREEAGLTQEQLAAQAGYDPKTVGLRERASVDLGALRSYVILLRAIAAKKAGERK